ncbi:hypothetical protein RYX36_020077, partial [Vicia faba]
GEPPKSINELHVKVNPSDKHVMVDGHPIDTPFIDKSFDDIVNDNYVSTEDSSDDENYQNVEVELSKFHFNDEDTTSRRSGDENSKLLRKSYELITEAVQGVDENTLKMTLLKSLYVEKFKGEHRELMLED